MHAPSLTVALPVFNGIKYLAPALESIARQSFREFEAIVVDDGSTDNSVEIASGFAEVDSRFRVIATDHLGVVSARNLIIELARAPLVAFCDADDLNLPSRFERQLAHMQRQANCVAVGAAAINIDANGVELSRWTPPKSCSLGRTPPSDVFISQPVAMVRLDALRAIGGYRRAFTLAEDKDLWLRLVEVGRLDNLSTHLFKYRHHDGQVSRLYREQQRFRAQIALALFEARRSGGEPDWDSTAPLTADSAARLASSCDRKVGEMINRAINALEMEADS